MPDPIPTAPSARHWPRHVIESVIEALIAELDARDGDTEAEPDDDGEPDYDAEAEEDIGEFDHLPDTPTGSIP